MNINQILIERVTNADEITRNGLKNITYHILFGNICLLSVLIIAMVYSLNDYSETGFIYNSIFCITAVIGIYLNYIVTKITRLYDEIGKIGNKIIVECVTNNELNENNENKQE